MRNTPRHTAIKLTKIKDKDEILKAIREKKQIAYKGTSVRPWADFSTETLQARWEWHDIFIVMKGKNLQPRLLYPARLSFRFDGEIKRFQISKIKRVLHHQTSFTTNAKGTSLGRKMQRRKRPTENKPKTIRKMVMGSYVSIITLNANGLNAPTKRHRLTGWMKTCSCMNFHLPHHSAWRCSLLLLSHFSCVRLFPTS